jgi:hypothetical protein
VRCYVLPFGNAAKTCELYRALLPRIGSQTERMITRCEVREAGAPPTSNAAGAGSSTSLMRNCEARDLPFSARPEFPERTLRGTARHLRA